jgi:hypothetical protein
MVERAVRTLVVDPWEKRGCHTYEEVHPIDHVTYCLLVLQLHILSKRLTCVIREYCTC